MTAYVNHHNSVLKRVVQTFSSQDHNYVPPRRHEYSELFKRKGDFELREMTEDAPIVILARVILQQLIGWVCLHPIRFSFSESH